MYQVELDTFRGPLDLLLFLVRKEEMEITDIPIARITDQYLHYLEVLKNLDVNAVGEFLVLASTLLEIKSRQVLPHGGEVEEQLEDPRQDLVRQLLQYKKYKDAASMLEERGAAWQNRFARQSRDLPPRKRDLAEQPIHEVELWDLVSAFGRIMREHQVTQPTNIVYDDTPIETFMERIEQQLAGDQRLNFGDLFAAGMHKSTLIGLFLAVLELVRHHKIHVEQSHPFGDLQVWKDEGSEKSEV